MFDNPVWDNPFDNERPFGIETDQLSIPFQSKGTKVLFKSRAPTDYELGSCPIIQLTSRIPWEPRKVQLSQTRTELWKDQILVPDLYDPRSNQCELQSVDPILNPLQWREVSQVQRFDPRTRDIQVQPTFESKRHERTTPEEFAEKVCISVDRARATFQATLQRGVQSAVLPLARRYRADRMFKKPILKGTFSTDTAYFKCKSLRGNIASQIYFHKV